MIQLLPDRDVQLLSIPEIPIKVTGNCLVCEPELFWQRLLCIAGSLIKVFLFSLPANGNRRIKRYSENNVRTRKPFFVGHAPVLTGNQPEPEFPFIP